MIREYTPEERRVCDYLQLIAPDVGCGDDPIGFLIASHGALVAELKLLRKLNDPAGRGQITREGLVLDDEGRVAGFKG